MKAKQAPNTSRPTIAIRGGVVVNEAAAAPSTVLVADGVVTGLLAPDQSIPRETERVIDADGLLVLPGAVDAHCHVDTEVGAFRTRDDYSSATEAAVWGGTTTIVDFAIPLPDQSPLEAVMQRRSLMVDTRCDIALHGCVINWTQDSLAELAEMAEMGVRTIKLFTTYRDVLMASTSTVRQVMTFLASSGGMAYVHAESNPLIEAAQAEQIRRGEMDATHHPATRPEESEVAEVVDVLRIAEEVGAHVYLVHQSTPDAVQAVTAARGRGVHAYSETCPHYLLLTEAAYGHELPERFVCCPPLRSRESVTGLRKLTLSGEVHTVASDHNCFDLHQKLENRADVRAMPNGLPGVETRLPLMFSELVNTHGLSPSALVRLPCANPAKLNGIYPRKGVINVGSDADIVVIDPNATRTVKVGDLHQDADYTPYEGWAVKGCPRYVLVGGQVAVEDGEWRSTAGPGRFLEATPFPQARVC